MSFEAFQDKLTNVRAVRIPAALSGPKRSQFVKAVRQLVEKQAELAKRCDAVLELQGVDVEDDRLLIRHERAFPFHAGAVLEDNTRPDIMTLWWLTAPALRAQRAAVAAGLVHGGYQFGSLLLDRIGRVKVADFGLAPLIETACGVDARGLLAFDDQPAEHPEGARLSGCWEVLTENDQRPYGWVRPFFPNEVLSAEARLNPTADQYSLGVLLFLLATGAHPYEVELSDHELAFILLGEPHAPATFRSDWSDTFDRAGGGAALSADRSLLDWSELVVRLLAADARGRFDDLAKAEELAAPHLPAVWNEAKEGLAQLLELLPHREFDPFLSGVGGWSENSELPAAWRSALGACIRLVEREKARAGKTRELRDQLEEARRLAGSAEERVVQQARDLAERIASGSDAPQDLREQAAELAEHCRGLIDNILANKDELAQHYLETAEQRIGELDFAGARELAQAVLDDGRLRSARESDARALLTRADQMEQQHARFARELEAAQQALENADYEDAHTRLTALRAAELPEGSREQVEKLLATAGGALERRREAVATIEAAQEALRRGDTKQARGLIEQVLIDWSAPDPWVAERRDELQDACERLEHAGQQLDQARSLAEAGQPAAAMRVASALLADGAIPEAARVAAQEIVQGCQGRLSAQRQEALGAARAKLARARDALESLDPDGCETRLGEIGEDALEDEDRAAIAKLREAGGRLRSSTKAAAGAEASLESGDLAAALHDLMAIDVAGLPAAFAGRVGELKRAVESARKQQRAGLQKELTDAQAALEQLDLRLCEQRLKSALQRSTQAGPSEDPDLSRLRGALARAKSGLDACQAADELRAKSEFGAARARLSPVERRDQPAELLRRLDETAARIDAEERAQLDAHERAAREALQGASRLIEQGDLPKAEQALASISAAAGTSPELARDVAQAHEQLEAGKRVEAGVTRAETALRDRSPQALAEALASLALDAPRPPWAAAREAALRESAAKLRVELAAERVEQARSELDNAERTLDAAGLGRAQTLLKAVDPKTLSDDALKRRRAEQVQRLKSLAQWFERLDQSRSLLSGGDLPAALRESQAAQQAPDAPKAVRAEFKRLAEQASAAIDAASKKVERAIAALRGELEGALYLPKGFAGRITETRALPFATDAQAAELAELDARAAKLPTRRPLPAPAMISGGVLVVVAAAVLWLVFKPSETHGDDAALEAARQGLQALVRAGEAGGRRPRAAWQAALAEDSGAIVAHDPSGAQRPVELIPDAADASPQEIARAMESIANDEDTLLALFEPLPIPPERPDPDDLARLGEALAALAKRFEPDWRPRRAWSFRFATDELPTELELTSTENPDEAIPVVAGYDAAGLAGALERVAQINQDNPLFTQLFERVVRDPAVGPLPQWLSRELGVDAPALQGAFNYLTGEAGLDGAIESLAAELTSARSTVQQEGEQATVTVALVGARVGELGGEFDLRWSEGVWAPAPTNAEAFKTLCDLAAQNLARGLGALVAAARQDRLQGRLKSFHEALRAAREIEARVGGLTADQSLAGAARQEADALGALPVPPAWSQRPSWLADVPESETDTGYPDTIEIGGRTLALVSIPPADAIWERLGQAAPADGAAAFNELVQAAKQPPEERPWRLFYLGEDEIAADASANAPESAERALSQLADGVRLPSADEWLLALLAQDAGRAPGIRDLAAGLRDWTRGPGGEPFACGVATAQIEALGDWGKPLSPPKGFDAIWAWANHPLVTQRRAQAQDAELMGYRAAWAP